MFLLINKRLHGAEFTSRPKLLNGNNVHLRHR